jgi:hypothetical protein
VDGPASRPYSLLIWRLSARRVARHIYEQAVVKASGKLFHCGIFPNIYSASSA